MLALYILVLAYLLIAARHIGKQRIPMWVPMLLGGLAVIVGGAITPQQAFASIDFGILIFLFCMFVVMQAMESSGYLEEIANRFFLGAKNSDSFLLLILAFAGIGSAILMNDTIALVGVPMICYVSKRFKTSPIPALMALAFGVTIGSVLSPIGNPQNLLIALSSKMPAPFLSFFSLLLIPTFINIAVCFFLLKFFYRKELRDFTPSEGKSISMVRDRSLARVSKISMLAIILLILIELSLGIFSTLYRIPLPAIALAGAAIVLLLSPRRLEMASKVDWGTILFFIGMFVLMQAVWLSGILQSFLSSSHFALADMGTILGISVLFSQILSNVPFVALYLPLLAGAQQKAFLALAAGSTLAGNLTLLGAASNIIIVQNSEKRGIFISFFEFLKVGAVLTLVSVIVVYVCLSLF